MYIPAHFREERVEVMHDLIRRHSLATLVTLEPGGLNANHVPLLISPEPAPLGTLRGHVSRANAMWSDFDPKVQTLAIFSGPEAYISPSWYATKEETGKVVPTWNYVAVHAYGRLEVFHDSERLKEIVRTLTEVHEGIFERPWSIDDAPAGYVDTLLNGIVGIEIKIDRLQGKWKVSQNRPPADQVRVAAALESAPDENARELSRLMRK
jgi:transcriptional regulator